MTQPNTPPPVWMTIPQACEALGLTKQALYNRMRKGLPFAYIQGTRQRRIRRQDLLYADTDGYLTVPQALDYLQLSKTTLYAKMRSGELEFIYKSGSRQRLIKQSDLDALMIPGNPDDSDNEADEV